MEDRHEEVPPGITNKVLHQAFLIAFRRIAEIQIEGIVSLEREVSGLRLSIEAEPVLNCNFGIVEDYPSWHTSEIVEGKLLGFQERLFVGSLVSNDEDIATET
jgi:hypothetical protein